MKQIIVTLLLPIYILIKLLYKILDIVFENAAPLMDGIFTLQETTYDYWKNIFKWKE